MQRATAKACQRRDQRYPTSIAATIIADRQEYVADIKDISSLGCCMSSAPVLEKGDEIIVVVGGVSMVATVAWCKGLLAGANFHREIDPLKFVRDHSNHQLFTRRRLANTMIAIAG